MALDVIGGGSPPTGGGGTTNPGTSSALRIVGGLNIGSGGFAYTALSANPLIVVSSTVFRILGTNLFDGVSAGDTVDIVLPNIADTVRGVPKADIVGQRVVLASPAPTASNLYFTPASNFTSTGGTHGGGGGSAGLPDSLLFDEDTDIPLFFDVDDSEGIYNSKLRFRSLTPGRGITMDYSTPQAMPDGLLTGTTTANNTTTINGSATQFLDELEVGNLLKLSGTSGTGEVLAINSNSQIILDTALGDGSTQTMEIFVQAQIKIGLAPDGGIY